MKTIKMPYKSNVDVLTPEQAIADICAEAFSGSSVSKLTKSIRKKRVDVALGSLVAFNQSGGFHRHLVAKAGDGNLPG